MNNKFPAEWIEKTKKLNQDREIKRGDVVIDLWRCKGVIVKISNGSIFVWQSERTDYGSDNCEHYSIGNWKDVLRILDE